MPSPDRPPEFGARTYQIAPNGEIAMVDEYHRYKPATGETIPMFLSRIARVLGQPLTVEIVFHRGQIAHADARPSRG